jgi:hypothetical protein
VVQLQDLRRSLQTFFEIVLYQTSLFDVSKVLKKNYIFWYTNIVYQNVIMQFHNSTSDHFLSFAEMINRSALEQESSISNITSLPNKSYDFKLSIIYFTCSCYFMYLKLRANPGTANCSRFPQITSLEYINSGTCSNHNQLSLITL